MPTNKELFAKGEGGFDPTEGWNGETFDYNLIQGEGSVTAPQLLATLAMKGMQGWEVCAALTIEGAPTLVLKRKRSALAPRNPGFPFVVQS